MAEKRILIVRLSAIGDVIHALPAARAIKKALPGSFVGWVVEDWAAPVIEGNPDVDVIFKIPKKSWREGRSLAGKLGDVLDLRRRMRSFNFDTAIDFQGLAKSGVAAYLSGARTRIGFAGEESAEFNFLFINERVKVPPGKVHVVEKNMHLLTALGIENPAIEFRLFFGREDEDAADGFLSKTGLSKGAFAVLNPGAGWVTKRWRPARFGEAGRMLLEKKGVRSVATWASGAERKMAEEIAAASGGAAVVAPETSLKGLAALISRAALFIGCDTGPTHIAAALGVPVVALFGAADGKRNGPYSDRAVVIRKGLDCSPCWKRKNCPRGVLCMEEIGAVEVFDAAVGLLGGRE